MFKGHDKIQYYKKPNHYIVECKRCGEYNDWLRYSETDDL